MRLSFHCPSCKGRLEADASLSGGQADCPQCGRPVAIPEPRVAAGTTLAGFRLERRLGKGGMGEVYLAQQLSVERQVAVKILPPGFAENPQAVKRFLHEGKLAARLDHFNIVTVHEAGEDSGNYYLAMAYVDGESLEQRLKRDKVLPEAEALAIIRTIADALAYAWGTFQLLHRDLKPANIMVDRRGRVFLMDLGLAKSLGDESGMTLSGSILGTPQYMSPEQARGLADLGVQTDVYSLGATLYHLVTGTPPFTGDTTLTVLHNLMYEPLPPPRSRNPKVTEACSHLIETMMAKEPAGRYGDWRALIADIDRVLQGKAPAAHRPGAGASVVMPAPGRTAVPAEPAANQADLARQAQEALARQHQAQAAKPAVAPAAPAAAKRPPWLAIGMVAAVVVGLVLLGVVVGRGRGPAAAAKANGTDRTNGTHGTAGSAATRPAAPTATTAEVAAGRRTAAQAAPAAVSEPAPAIPPTAAPATAAPERQQASPTNPTGPTRQTAPPPAPDAATPSRPGAPVPGPTAADAAVTPDPSPAKLAALLEQVAADLVAGKPAEALRRWQAGRDAPELKPVAEQVTAIGEVLGEVTSIPRHLLESFQADVGKTVEIELLKERITCEVREVTAAGIKVNQTIKRGQATGKMGRTVTLGELSPQERLRRLGTGDGPELDLQRGLLALGAGRPDDARRLFETAGGPLGTALVAQIEAQRAEASEAAAERALSELLRQISGSPELGKPAKANASIRKRCGDNPKRYEDGRRLLAAFEKEWGLKEPGKTWVPVLQEALAYPPRQDWTVPDLGLELVWVAPGSFQMGAADVAPPVHTVQISRGYWLGRYEVTQAEYEALMGKNPSLFKGARNPVETVSWSNAVAFCTKLTEREQKAGRLPEGYEYRLPTEAEWEYAARGGPKSQATSAGSGQGLTYSGSNNVDEVAWYKGNSGDRRLDDAEADTKKRESNLSSNKCRAHPVGQRKPNELGLYDLSGNVWEWCLDWYDESYYSRSPGTDPVNLQAGSSRVFRGGGWGDGAASCRVAYRRSNGPSNSDDGLGFRVALAPAIPAAAP